ncbi:MAG: type I-C CRISPR-associated protein Cas8c/Csd1 [Clostridiales bacterium]|nr:type I-C CRISPR-associated protein Cas8c/Csd1 [Clostridiales bacterium]
MSWLNRLVDTYDNCTGEIGKIVMVKRKKEEIPLTPLLPLYHTTQSAHIEITLDEGGNWVPLGAHVPGRGEGITIIPCTESSANRTSGLCPHPLFDKLAYIAGDYLSYGGKKKSGYPDYLRQLEDWCASPFSHPRVCAVLAYLKKGCLIHDLVEDGILRTGENSQLLKKWDGAREDTPHILSVLPGDQADAFVRFRMLTEPGGEPRLWMDEDIRRLFIEYQRSRQEERDLCYVSGKYLPRAEMSPGKIRHSGDKAKLISSNDSTGFTYRGRFTEARQAACISAEATQKAHNALKWLIDRQGWRNGDQVILCWGTENQPVPPLQTDTFGLGDALGEPLELPVQTFAQLAGRLNRALSGYYGKGLNAGSQTSVIGLDSATPGRLSITFYRELQNSELLERVVRWHATCCWQIRDKGEPAGFDDRGRPLYRTVTFYGAPAPADIVQAAYGPMAGEKLIKATTERLLSCIIDGAPLPPDLVECAVRRASHPPAVERWEYRRTLDVACALVRKSRNDRLNPRQTGSTYKEVWTMALDPQCTDRSYLFGRLLAYADQAESRALAGDRKKESDSRHPTRLTNALRLKRQFSLTPRRTWSYIDNQLTYYYRKLNDRGSWFRGEIAQVMSLFLPDDFSDDRLEDVYLLGYYSQLALLRSKKEDRPAGAEESYNH